MARLGCKCGAEMTNTEAPSKHELNVFYKSEAEVAIKGNPEIRLWDFYTGWDEKNNCENSFQNRKEPVEYWFCTECKRVHEVQAVSCGRIVRSFEPLEIGVNQLIDYSTLEELIVLTDFEMDELLSTHENMTLSEYIEHEAQARYFITSDEKKVYIVKDGQLTGMYSCEDKGEEHK
jgi:hypothetical protein